MLLEIQFRGKQTSDCYIYLSTEIQISQKVQNTYEVLLKTNTETPDSRLKQN